MLLAVAGDFTGPANFSVDLDLHHYDVLLRRSYTLRQSLLDAATHRSSHFTRSQLLTRYCLVKSTVKLRSIWYLLLLLLLTQYLIPNLVNELSERRWI